MSTLDRYLWSLVLIGLVAVLVWPLFFILKDEGRRRAIKQEFYTECMRQSQSDAPELYKKYVCYNTIYK